MNSRITLQIQTGAGNYALVANLGTFNPAYIPLTDIALGSSVYDLNTVDASNVANQMANAIYALRNKRGSFSGLTEIEQGYREDVLNLFVNIFNQCTAHPSAIVFVIP